MTPSPRAARSLDDALGQALEDLEAGLTPLQVLDRYPNYEAELGPLLETAYRLRTSRWPTLSLAARVAGREKIHAALAAEKARRRFVLAPFWGRLGAGVALALLAGTTYFASPLSPLRHGQEPRTAVPAAATVTATWTVALPPIQPSATVVAFATPQWGPTRPPRSTQEPTDDIKWVLAPTATPEPSATATPRPRATATRPPSPTRKAAPAPGQLVPTAAAPTQAPDAVKPTAASTQGQDTSQASPVPPTPSATPTNTPQPQRTNTPRPSETPRVTPGKPTLSPTTRPTREPEPTDAPTETSRPPTWTPTNTPIPPTATNKPTSTPGWTRPPDITLTPQVTPTPKAGKTPEPTEADVRARLPQLLKPGAAAPAKELRTLIQEARQTPPALPKPRGNRR